MGNNTQLAAYPDAINVDPFQFCVNQCVGQRTLAESYGHEHFNDL